MRLSTFNFTNQVIANFFNPINFYLGYKDWENAIIPRN